MDSDRAGFRLQLPAHFISTRPVRLSVGRRVGYELVE